MASDPYELAADAAALLAGLTNVPRHDVALVLGSGWGRAADRLGDIAAEISSSDLPGFSEPTARGHRGRIRSIHAGDQRLLVFLGRTHLYEGLGASAAVHGIRTAAAAGCRVIVLTNAAGGLDPAWVPGTAVLISDHINLTGVSPLVGPRFHDLSDLYSFRLRGLAKAVDPNLPEGVYAQFPGPQYETPAEVRMAGILGATLVGMSTAVEAVAAREAGLEVLGISLVTNLAAGLGPALDPGEVLAEGEAAAERLGDLLAEILPLLAGH